MPPSILRLTAGPTRLGRRLSLVLLVLKMLLKTWDDLSHIIGETRGGDTDQCSLDAFPCLDRLLSTRATVFATS